MKPTYLKSMRTIRHLLAICNFAIILLMAGIILFSTKYICETGLARDFLDSIQYLPQNPLRIFWTTIISFGALMLIMFFRANNSMEDNRVNVYSSLMEVLLSCLIIYSLYMGYNGIAFLVFIDIIIHLKDNNYTIWFLGVLVIVLLLSNHDVISSMYPMASINDFIKVYTTSISTTLIVVINLLESSNLILFIIFMILYIAQQIQENERIQQELLMINQVNTQLKEYAEITEQIGKNRERKRLARELHDTLGHALTGIAAGVDACISMIDISPTETKKQLFIISKVVREGINDVRNSLNKLRPGALEKYTFEESIHKMIDEFQKVSNVEVNLDYEVEKIDFEKTKENIVFRLIQESMTNALRHGKATKIDIHIYLQENNFMIEIQDNGIGAPVIHKGFGLTHMEERLEVIDGQVEFNGRQGFYIKVTIPIMRGEKYD